MCCRAPTFAILTLAQWCYLIGWMTWGLYTKNLPYLAVIISPWLMLTMIILMCYGYISNPLTLTQATSLIGKFYHPPSSPLMEGMAYHYSDVHDTLKFIPTAQEQRMYDVNITNTLTYQLQPTTARFIILTIESNWLYTDETSKINQQRQLAAFKAELGRRDRHVTINTNHGTDLTTKISYLVVKDHKPRFSTLVLSALLGMAWFYVEWLLRHSEHQQIDVRYHLAFTSAPLTILEAGPIHPCTCVSCRTTQV